LAITAVGRRKSLRYPFCAWTKDDAYIACSTEDPSPRSDDPNSSHSDIHIWETATRRLVHVLKRHEMLVILVMAHPTDPRVVVSTGYDGRVIFWDVIRGTLLREFVIEFMDLGNPLDCLDGAFSPDGMTRKCISVCSYSSHFPQVLRVCR